MFNPFRDVSRIKAEVFTSMPAKFRNRRRTEWSDPNLQGKEVVCSIEGPSFDREGNLFIVDTPFGRIFRITPTGDWDLVVQYDGWPNGSKFHKDGRLFVADYRKGIMVLDVKAGRIEPLLGTAYSEGFKGCNDLNFSSTGDLYFTDQGQTGIADPTGRVFRMKPNGSLQRMINNAPSPNGVTVNTVDKQVFVAMTRSQQIWRCPLMDDGQFSKAGVAIQFTGGVGPDGIETDAEDGLVVCHLGTGVWRFDANMLPTQLVCSDRHQPSHLANLAFGGPDYKTIYMVDAQSGDVLTAVLPVAGKKTFGLQ
jgi:gluconolactonase